MIRSVQMFTARNGQNQAYSIQNLKNLNKDYYEV